MAGDAAAFLRWNKEELFKALLAAEGHLRAAGPGTQDLSCVVKHLAEAESHADEAVSHAAELGDDLASSRFRGLRDAARDLRRAVQGGSVPLEEAIRRVRALRRALEEAAPEFDVSRCRACGEAAASLAALLEGLGGKALKSGGRHSAAGGSLATWREVGVIYGACHLAKGLARGLDELDRYLGRSGAPPHERPSAWINVGLGVALPVVAAALKVKEPWSTLMVVAGAHLSTKLWDYVEEYVAAGAARYVPASPPVVPAAPAAQHRPLM